MMMKFLSLLARAQVVTMNTDTVVEVHQAEVIGQPENQVVRFSWTDGTLGACSTGLTEEGLAAVTFDAASNTFQLEDYEGDLVTLMLTAGDEVLMPDSEGKSLGFPEGEAE